MPPEVKTLPVLIALALLIVAGRSFADDTPAATSQPAANKEVLVGVEYFAGWWEELPNKWHGHGWTAEEPDWRLKYPQRVPLSARTTTRRPWTGRSSPPPSTAWISSRSSGISPRPGNDRTKPQSSIGDWRTFCTRPRPIDCTWCWSIATTTSRRHTATRNGTSALPCLWRRCGTRATSAWGADWYSRSTTQGDFSGRATAMNSVAAPG